MRFLNDKVLAAANINATVASDPICASFMLQVSAISVVTGSSPVGVISIQASNDIPPNGQLSPFTPTNWNDIATVAVNATGSFVIPKTDTCYEWIRVKYTRTSGSGAITTIIKTNGV